MISKKIEKMLNEQLNKEMFSANLYLSICSYFNDLELDGFAHFFKMQAQEELQHADKQFEYVHDAGGKVEMLPVDKPQTKFKSIVDAFQLALAHEKEVTQSINSIVKQALDENDFATHAFLNWFVSEQVEEEALFNNLLAKLKMIGDSTQALFLMDSELGSRSSAPE